MTYSERKSATASTRTTAALGWGTGVAQVCRSGGRRSCGPRPADRVRFHAAPAHALAAALVSTSRGRPRAWSIRRTYAFPGPGLCNLVTLTRLVLVSALVVPVARALATGPGPSSRSRRVALSLDGVDGWLARREGLVSAFGARFDMEVDALSRWCLR